MSNRILLASAAALLAAGPALAGGFALPVATPAPAAPVIVPVTPVIATNDWSGAYVGGHLGFGRLSFDDNDDDADLALEEDSYNGAVYGLQAGYMFDFGRIVAGAEVDFSGTQIEVDAEDAAADLNVMTDDAVNVGSVIRGKLRVGFDAGRVLPYVTAGVAQVRLNSDDDVVDEALEDSYNGRFVGIGAEFMVSDRFMVGVEALRHQFDDTPSFVDQESGIEAMVDTVSLRGSFRF
jgi:opacity protein-like surface antigen